MSFEKNDKVSVKTKTGEMSGTIKNRFIQTTELDYSGETLIADASEENPVYLVEFDNGKSEMVNEHAISMNRSQEDRQN
ncbi:MAG TPA: HVA1 family protein [Cryomorphaceae bacterium]|nr:HVA1 family protein [Cryomorphaceae bacterium]